MLFTFLKLSAENAVCIVVFTNAARWRSNYQKDKKRNMSKQASLRLCEGVPYIFNNNMMNGEWDNIVRKPQRNVSGMKYVHWRSLRVKNSRKCSHQCLSNATLIAPEPFSLLLCCFKTSACLLFTFNPLQFQSDFVKVVCITFERICHWNKKAWGRRSRGQSNQGSWKAWKYHYS